MFLVLNRCGRQPESSANLPGKSCLASVYFDCRRPTIRQLLTRNKLQPRFQIAIRTRTSKSDSHVRRQRSAPGCLRSRTWGLPVRSVDYGSTYAWPEGQSQRSIRNAANQLNRSVTLSRSTIPLLLHLVVNVAPTGFALPRRVFVPVKYSRRRLSL